MRGFNVASAEKVITNAVYEHFAKGANEIRAELASDGYKDIIADFYVDDYLQNINITLMDGVKIEDQNIFFVLAYGGAIAKNDEYITIPPSETLKKYIGKR